MRRRKIINKHQDTNNGAGKFFIIGLRRSGTSIFRNLILKSPDIIDIMFEPHELMHAAQLLKIPRYKKSGYYPKVIRKFNQLPKWSGAKIALNPGIDAMDWVWLYKKFPNTKFLFIIRNVDSNYKSYYKADTNTFRGTIPQSIYKPFHKVMNNGFKKFHSTHPEASAIINYDKMLVDVDQEICKAWDLLKIKSPGSLKLMIKQPKN